MWGSKGVRERKEEDLSLFYVTIEMHIKLNTAEYKKTYQYLIWILMRLFIRKQTICRLFIIVQPFVF